jgi:hypothetical protein
MLSLPLLLLTLRGQLLKGPLLLLLLLAQDLRHVDPLRGTATIHSRERGRQLLLMLLLLRHHLPALDGGRVVLRRQRRRGLGHLRDYGPQAEWVVVGVQRRRGLVRRLQLNVLLVVLLLLLGL